MHGEGWPSRLASTAGTHTTPPHGTIVTRRPRSPKPPSQVAGHGRQAGPIVSIRGSRARVAVAAQRRPLFRARPPRAAIPETRKCQSRRRVADGEAGVLLGSREVGGRRVRARARRTHRQKFDDRVAVQGLRGQRHTHTHAHKPVRENVVRGRGQPVDSAECGRALRPQPSHGSRGEQHHRCTAVQRTAACARMGPMSFRSLPLGISTAVLPRCAPRPHPARRQEASSGMT
jgi:hypothetical protein